MGIGWRPEGWENPYEEVLRTFKTFTNQDNHYYASTIYEAGASAILKAVIDDIEYHGEGCHSEGGVMPWKTAESIIIPMWYLRELKGEE